MARADQRQQSGKRAGVLALAGAAALAVFAHGVEPLATGTAPLALTGTALAQNEGVTTSKAVYDAYIEAQEFLDNGDANAAARRIRQVLDSGDELNALEQGILYRFLANVELERERYPQAIDALERAVRSGAFEGPQLAELYFFMGGLYLTVERYDEAIQSLQRFFDLAETPNAAAYYLLAQAYAVQERWRDALQPARRAVELSETPNEGYLRLLAAAYINLEDWRTAVPLLERIVRLFPTKDEYWQQLAAGYQELNRARDAYAVQELRYQQGFLDNGSDIVILADLHAFYGYPYKGARLLATEMERGRVERTSENLERLGNYWLGAREYTRARRALIQASERGGTGRLDFQIAGTFAQDEEWEQTERYLQRALRRGGLSGTQRANAWLLLGHARNNLGRRAAAIQAFENAAEFQTTRDDAETWLTFLRNQIAIERQQQLVTAVETLNIMLDRSSNALTDLEALENTSIDALAAARRARDADTDQSRQRALQEYNIRVEQAEAILDRQTPQMAEDMEPSMTAIEAVRQLDMDSPTEQAVNELESMIAERERILATARANLNRANEIILFINGAGPDPDVVNPEGEEGEAEDTPAEGGDAGDADATDSDAPDGEEADEADAAETADGETAEDEAGDTETEEQPQ